MSVMPTFLVIGAARSGTTALYQYLKQHPDVFMPSAKEPNFFAFEGETLAFRGPAPDWVNNSCTSLADYKALMQGGAGFKARGEASPLYLYVPGTAQRIKAHVPDVKLIAILRDPAEQAYSHFLYAKRNMIEPLDDFHEALHLEEERMADGWQPLFNYSRFPRYAEQLTRFYDQFPADRIKVFLYEDFDRDPLKVLREIFEFIGVDPAFTPDVSHRPNAGGVPKNKALQDLVMRPNIANRIAGAFLPLAVRNRLKDMFTELNAERETIPRQAKALLRQRQNADTRQLAELLGRDLSAWMT